MINTDLCLLVSTVNMTRKQLKCANMLRENHLNITLSTINLTYIYIMKAKNSMNLIPESHIHSGFYSHHIIHVTESFIFINTIMNCTIKTCAHLFSLSISSDSLQPLGLQPTSLLCPRDSPGKNTGMGFHALLQGIFSTPFMSPALASGPFTTEPRGKPQSSQ